MIKIKFGAAAKGSMLRDAGFFPHKLKFMAMTNQIIGMCASDVFIKTNF